MNRSKLRKDGETTGGWAAVFSNSRIALHKVAIRNVVLTSASANIMYQKSRTRTRAGSTGARYQWLSLELQMLLSPHDALAGYAVLASEPREEPNVYDRGAAVLGPGNRREHGDIQSDGS